MTLIESLSTDLHDFPNADMTSDETTEYFAGQFGLNAEEVTT